MQGWKGILCKLQRCHAGREMNFMQGWDVCNAVKKRIQCRDAECCHAVREGDVMWTGEGMVCTKLPVFEYQDL
jgi:hypothetical protein